jgi:hypothetical protein
VFPLLIVLLAVGCGGRSNIKAKGWVRKGGEPYLTNKGDGMRIIFAPLEGTDGRYDSFAAVYQPTDGSFQVVGKDGTGLPPGKYQVSLQHLRARQDVLKGRFVGKNSPFLLNVKRGGNDLVLDLDQPSSDQ